MDKYFEETQARAQECGKKIFIEVLFVMAETASEWPSTEKWTNNLWCINMMECSTELKWLKYSSVDQHGQISKA